MALCSPRTRQRAQQLRAAETLWNTLIDVLTDEVRVRYPAMQELDWTVQIGAASIYGAVPTQLPEDTAREVWSAWVDYFGATKLPEIETDSETLLRATVKRYGSHLVNVTVGARVARIPAQRRAHEPTLEVQRSARK